MTSKPKNEFIKGTKLRAVEEFSKELTDSSAYSIQEVYEILSPEDTEKKNRDE
ncbi:hypothetical protein QA612_15865 [Evansella sp. AB-P1]|uniref:hypothetical protein n=1 Tax=Evansella sp. AB-P1 TaxID=3037653 RepID=UPI00241F8B50|nr:hypothetical protein [Evansella sp. AB-P1]MDG5788933.1 hypothetical protein [Evansella sp. AB-P1]